MTSIPRPQTSSSSSSSGAYFGLVGVERSPFGRRLTRQEDRSSRSQLMSHQQILLAIGRCISTSSNSKHETLSQVSPGLMSFLCLAYTLMSLFGVHMLLHWAGWTTNKLHTSGFEKSLDLISNLLDWSPSNLSGAAWIINRTESNGGDL